MTAAEELLAWLEENRNEKNIEGMARFGIRKSNTESLARYDTNCRGETLWLGSKRRRAA